MWTTPNAWKIARHATAYVIVRIAGNPCVMFALSFPHSHVCAYLFVEVITWTAIYWLCQYAATTSYAETKLQTYGTAKESDGLCQKNLLTRAQWDPLAPRGRTQAQRAEFPKC